MYSIQETLCPCKHIQHCSRCQGCYSNKNRPTSLPSLSLNFIRRDNHVEVKHGKRSGSVVGYHFRQAVQRSPGEMACAIKTWEAGGMHSRQKQTQWPWNVSWILVVPLSTSSNALPRDFLTIPVRMAFFLPQFLVDTARILSWSVIICRYCPQKYSLKKISYPKDKQTQWGTLVNFPAAVS